MPKEQINAMGTLNNRWGVCGFNSSLYALYEHNPRKRADLTSAAKVDTRVAAEIKTFLKMLQAEGNAKLLSDIEAFTRSFGGKRAGFTIAGYIQKIDAEAAKEGGKFKAKMRPDLSLALPPHAVVAYLQKVAGFPGAKVVTDPVGGNLLTSSTANEQIIGIRDPKMASYNGLAHWVYMNNGVVYSWGRQFTSIQQAGDECGCTGVACIVELV